jgi:hypothetical protein
MYKTYHDEILGRKIWYIPTPGVKMGGREKYSTSYRILTEDLPRTPIGEDQTLLIDDTNSKSNFLSDIEFLTIYRQSPSSHQHNAKVIYVGKCNHILELATMFPTTTFDIYGISSDVEMSKVTFHDNDFSKTDASKWAQDKYPSADILMISNMHFTDEKSLVQNQKKQKLWYKLIKPCVAMLKFQPPRGEKKMRYLKGSLYIPPFLSSDNTCVRLIIMGLQKEKYYDLTCAEQLNCHNQRSGVKYKSMGKPVDYNTAVREHINHEYDMLNIASENSTIVKKIQRSI